MKATILFLTILISSCSNRFDLVNKTFDENVIQSKDVLGHTKSYSFKKSTYIIEMIDAKHIPSAKYKIEEGNYYRENARLKLTPTKKVFCQIFPSTSHIPCDKIGSFIDTFYVVRDTLSPIEISDLGFNTRDVSILNGQDGLVLIDQNLAFKLLAIK